MIALIIIALDEASKEAASILTWGNITLAAGILMSLGNAYIILKSRQREEAHQQTVRQAAIYKERMEFYEREFNKEKERADTFETGYKALSGLNIRELLDFNALKRERDALDREATRLNEENVRKRLSEARDVS